MTDDSQSDVQQTLPPSEFDPRHPRAHDDASFSLPFMTAAKVKDRIADLLLDIEALKVIDGDSLFLQMAGLHVRRVLSNVEDHSRVADAALKFEIEHLR